MASKRMAKSDMHMDISALPKLLSRTAFFLLLRFGFPLLELQSSDLRQ
jgi:hypothetical protein